MNESVYRSEVIGHKNSVTPWGQDTPENAFRCSGVWNTVVTNQNGYTDLILLLAGLQLLLFTNTVRGTYGFGGVMKAVLFSCAKERLLWVEWLEWGRLYRTPEALVLFLPSQGLWNRVKGLLAWEHRKTVPKGGSGGNFVHAEATGGSGWVVVGALLGRQWKKWFGLSLWVSGNAAKTYVLKWDYLHTEVLRLCPLHFHYLM